MTWHKTLLWVTAAAVFAADRWSKWLVETTVGPFDTKPVIPGLLNVVSSRNPGVAFGIFSESVSNHRTAILVLLSVAALVILAVMLWRSDPADRRSAFGLALILGGALGNVCDRILRGTVTDFLDAYIGSYHWYTFNLADSAICVGAVLLLLAMWKPSGALARVA